MTLAVDRARVRLFRIPPARRMEDSTHVVTAVEVILLEIGAGDHAATGFAYTAGVGGTATAALLRDYCLEPLIGTDATDLQAAWDRMAGHLYRTGFGAITTLALSAIDTALWDLKARAANMPLWRLAGASAPGARVYASLIDLHSDPKALAADLTALKAQGYDWFKIKVGRASAEDDLATVRAARDAIGPEANLSLDANMGLTLDEAVRRAGHWAAHDIAWLEEPLDAGDIAGHAALRQAQPIPVAVGESLYTEAEVARYIDAGAVDIVQADIARIGGITPWLRVAGRAHAADLPMAPHYMMEWAAHLLPAVPNGLVAENVLGAGLADLGLTNTPPAIAKGRITPADAPGLGLTLAPDAVTAFEVPLGDALVRGARGRK